MGISSPTKGKQLNSDNIDVSKSLNNKNNNLNIIQNFNYNSTYDNLNNSKISNKIQIQNRNSLLTIQELPTESYYARKRDDFPSTLRTSVESKFSLKTSNKTIIIILKLTIISAVLVLSIHIFLRVFHGRGLTTENYFKNVFDFNSFSLRNSNFLDSLSLSYLTNLMNPSELFSYLISNFWKIALASLVFIIMVKKYFQRKKRKYYVKIAEEIHGKLISFLISCEVHERKKNTEEYLIKRFSEEFKIEENEFRNEIFPFLKEISKNCENIKISKIKSDYNDNSKEVSIWEWQD